ncbi:MAG: hypothetical protein QM762_28345 [Chryseolinea sp.]
MKRIVISVMRWIKRQLWSMIVAYMLGMYNFYHGDTKTADNASRKIEVHEEEENESP